MENDSCLSAWRRYQRQVFSAVDRSVLPRTAATLSKRFEERVVQVATWGCVARPGVAMLERLFAALVLALSVISVLLPLHEVTIASLASVQHVAEFTVPGGGHEAVPC